MDLRSRIKDAMRNLHSGEFDIITVMDLSKYYLDPYDNLMHRRIQKVIPKSTPRDIYIFYRHTGSELKFYIYKIDNSVIRSYTSIQNEPLDKIMDLVYDIIDGLCDDEIAEVAIKSIDNRERLRMFLDQYTDKILYSLNNNMLHLANVEFI